MTSRSLSFGLFVSKDVLAMVIDRIINNNVISILDGDKEVVVMGKGIGFKKKPGDKLDESAIEKKFVADNKAEVDKFGELIKSIPDLHLQVSMEIIEYAKLVMPRRLSPSVYISLTDHINFALERAKNGINFSNPLIEEVRGFYPSEYLVGEYGIALIERELGVRLPVDEAVSIALHLVNAEYTGDMSTTMHVTNLIKEVIDLVEKELGIKLNDMGLYYARFITHLKFLSQRIFTGQLMDNQDEEFIRMISGLYPKEFEISEKIGKFILDKYKKSITKEEEVYLTVHIRRIQPDVDKKEEH